MPSQFSSLGTLRVNDPVITNIVHSYANAEGIAGFIAPTVPVPVRAGKIIKFGKEAFSVLDLSRAPGTNLKRITPAFGVDTFYLEQHAIGAEVTREAYEEAENGQARIDLRSMAAMRAAALLQQSWEARVIDKVYDPTLYETNCVVSVGGPVVDYDILIQDAQEIIRGQVGRYANSAIIGSDVYRFIRRNPIYRDRVKYTSASSINSDMISSWWDLKRGVRSALRQKLDVTTGALTSMVPTGSILLFYNPEGSGNEGFIPDPAADPNTASFAYTYQLDGYPIAEEERFDEDRKVFVTDLIVEQNIVPVGMGVTGKIGAGVLIQGITS